MSYTVAVRHTFETGHRLPQLAGKCTSLHGHSWQVQVTVRGAQLDDNGVLLEFAHLKTQLRSWVDEHLDHGVMLGAADPLLPVLAAHGKVFTFGHGLAATLPWPTVEAVATLLGTVSTGLLATWMSDNPDGPALAVTAVVVRETAVNTATWTTRP